MHLIFLFCLQIDVEEWRRGFETVKTKGSKFWQKVSTAAQNIRDNWSWSSLFDDDEMGTTTIVPRIVVLAGDEEIK